MVNEKYSYKDFLGQSFTAVDPAEFDGTEIVGSCFYQENKPRSSIFPVGMTGVTFVRCNLDNVKVPAGNTIGPRCSNRQCQCQNDGHDWEINAANKPIRPLNEKQFLQDGLSTDPASIPAEKLLEIDVTKSEYDAATKWTDAAPVGNKPPQGIDFWYKAKPAIITTQVDEITAEVKDWNGTDKFVFDSTPTEIEKKGSVRVLRGDVTRYTIRGKVWRFRGE